MNHGIRMATSKYIWILNSGDNIFEFNRNNFEELVSNKFVCSPVNTDRKGNMIPILATSIKDIQRIPNKFNKIYPFLSLQIEKIFFIVFSINSI